MTQLITGGAGFLGSAIARVVENPLRFDIVHGKDIFYCDLDELDSNSLSKLFGDFQVDEVYHCAGLVGTSDLENNVELALEQNVMNSVKVFEAAKKAGVKKVFFPSKPLGQPNIYTITKEFAETLIRHSYPDVKVLRIFNLYGPGQSLFPVRRMLVNFVLRALNGLPIQVYGDGSQKVDMLHVDDAAETIVKFLRSEHTDVLDFGGHTMTVLEVAHSVFDQLGIRSNIEHLPMRVGDSANPPTADSKIYKLFPIWLRPWDTSLDETIRSYENHPQLQEALHFYKIK